nr:dTDP-4-dehydrorhamnose reductase [Desulfobulbaceae bacterium]
KIIITGANGQLGWELQRTRPEGIVAVALNSSELDITNWEKVLETVRTLSPQVIINAAAYTAVDKAEEEVDKAFAVNADGAANLAEAAKEVGARFVHISTDFVFDGLKSSPYLVSDPTNPAGVYGKSKLAGEQKIVEINGLENCAILRTAWVYSAHGNNFVKTMLRLMAERDSLGIVADQTGTPTWANGLAKAVWKLAQINQDGMFHWTDAGVASWYDFAVAIQEEALALGKSFHADTRKKSPSIPLCKGGLRGISECIINPIGTADYPLPAKRPPFSVLDKSETWAKLGFSGQHWRKALREMLKEL